MFQTIDIRGIFFYHKESLNLKLILINFNGK